ncbi:SPOR domain-containing protein [Mucilaginibacter robiniae]|uniref:SPOR domain-containing protein n=1 Tax=Mucilaginibacter robiniae TaxID=2728022 RepID=A0A7L5E127_9SPHI|nr:SPOR domain-containing protein [Mucilaginibacter robiniae]QJD97062.1 SPOR domain-containing protein [Mucilaginibacter robiniae]
MSKVVITSLFLLVGLSTARAQSRGHLEIIKDSRVDTLIAHRYSRNRAGSKTGGLMSAYGYRIQFFSGSSRKDAFNAQNKFQQEHPDIRTYISYREPNFKVKAGDFRTRLEAVKLMQSMQGKFISLFVISEKINPPNLDTSTPQ